MAIILNGKSFPVAENSSLTGLVEQLGLGDTRYAIEVNQEIVPRSEHPVFQLNDGDHVEIVQAIGGG